MKSLQLTNASYSELINAYRKHLDILGYSKGLIKNYPNFVRELLYYLEQKQLVLEAVEVQHLHQYYEQLKQRPSSRGGALSQSSLNHHIGAIKLFNQFLIRNGGRGFDVRIKPKKVSAQVTINDIVSKEEINQLFTACEKSSGNEHIRSRDKAILVLLYSCGLRRNEAVMLNTSDVH